MRIINTFDSIGFRKLWRISVCVAYFVSFNIRKISGQHELFKQNHKVCDAVGCLEEEPDSELRRWDCVGKRLFRPTSSVLDEKFVKHDCGGVGWGNSIRALYNSMSLALILNRRIIISFDSMQKLWSPPFGNVNSTENNSNAWDYGMGDALQHDHRRIYDMTETWDYEKYGRPPNRFKKWVKSLNQTSDATNTAWNEYNKPVLNAGWLLVLSLLIKNNVKLIISIGVCGGERDMIVTGNCFTVISLSFGKCAKSTSHPTYMTGPLLSVPYFSFTFSKPTKLMVS
jgi:hypothetical protein